MVLQAGLNQKWTVVSVNRILKNEYLYGNIEFRVTQEIKLQSEKRAMMLEVKTGVRVEDAHDAIISKGEFQQVQQLLELDTRTAPSADNSLSFVRFSALCRL